MIEIPMTLASKIDRLYIPLMTNLFIKFVYSYNKDSSVIQYGSYTSHDQPDFEVFSKTTIATCICMLGNPMTFNPLIRNSTV